MLNIPEAPPALAAHSNSRTILARKKVMRASYQLSHLEAMGHSAPLAWRRTWLPICLILGVAVLLRIPNFNESLWFDELWSTNIKLGSLRSLGYFAVYDVHPPFYLFFMYLWINIFGDSEISVRVPPLLFGLGSIFLAYLLVQRFTDRRTALLTSLLLTVSPVHIWYSQEARQYSALLFLILASVYCFYRSLDTELKSIWVWAYIASLCAALFTHYYAIAFLIGFSILSLREQARIRSRLLILNFSLLGVLTLFLTAKVLLTGLATSSTYLRSFTLIDLWHLFFGWYAFGNSLSQVPRRLDLAILRQSPVMVLVLATLVFLFVRAVGLLAVDSFRERNGSHSVDILLYLFSIPVLLLGLNFLGFKNIYIERSMFVGLPFFYLMLAIGATRFKSRRLAVISASFLIVLGAVTFQAYSRKADVWTVYKPNADWRSAAGYFDREFQGTDERVLVLAPTPAEELIYYNSSFIEFNSLGLEVGEQDARNEKDKSKSRIRHFIQRYLPEGLWRKPQVDPNQIRAQLYDLSEKEDVYTVLSKNHVRTFYLISNKFWTGSSLDCLEQIKSDMRLRPLGQQSFKGLTIYKFQVS